MYHYTDGGLRNVWLANGYEVRKTPFGEAVAIRDLEGLSEAICRALVEKAKPLTKTEFRYIRTSGLLLSQANLGSALGVDAQTVARWEKETKKMHKNYIKTRQRLRQVRTTSAVYQNALTDKDKETRALQEEVATLKAQLARTGLVKEVQDLKAELAIREKELGIRKFYGK